MTYAVDKVREICLALPDATEGMTWKHPVWRAGRSMFAGCEEVRGKWCVNVKLEESRTTIC